MKREKRRQLMRRQPMRKIPQRLRRRRQRMPLEMKLLAKTQRKKRLD
jgi:hypothetical protein